MSRAVQFAMKCHKGQTRKYTNEPFIYHPLRVSNYITLYYSFHPLYEMLYNSAILHDVIEDCNVSYVTIRNLFGKDVAKTVFSLTNPSQINSKYKDLPRAKRKKIDFENIGNSSWEVQLIKLFDRLDNIKSSYLGKRKFLLEKFIPETKELTNYLPLSYSLHKDEFDSALLDLQNYHEEKWY